MRCESHILYPRHATYLPRRPDVSRLRGSNTQRSQIQRRGLRCVPPVCDAQDLARAREVAEPDVPFFEGVAADELRLFAQGVLVDGDEFFVGDDGEGGVGEVGVEDAAEHEGGFVDGPHAEVEAFFFGGEDVETDAERGGLVGVGVVGVGNVQEHVHVGEGTGLGVSPVGDYLVCDAPDAAPGVVDIVAHSPCVANFRSPVIS